MDGKRTVGEICDLLALGEFDVYRMLADLVTRALVEEVPREQLHVAKSKQGKIAGKAAALVVLLLLAAVLGFIFVFKSYSVASLSILGVVVMSFLEIFVAFLQAYIFTFLTTIFIGFAVHPEH